MSTENTKYKSIGSEDSTKNCTRTYHVTATYWKHSKINNKNPFPKCPGVISSNKHNPILPKYMMVAIRLDACHILVNCDVGPLKKHVPINDKAFPIVTWTTIGVGLPNIKSLSLTNEPKLNM